MKRFLFLGWLIAGLLLTASCGGDSKESSDESAIEDIIKEYVAMYNDEDFDNYLNCFTGYEDKEDALAFLSFTRSFSGELELKEIKDITIVPVAVPGGNRTATASVTFIMSGEEGTDLMQLEEVDSSWKITWEQEGNTGEPAATPPPATR
jgi:hypothetical protein